MDNCLNGKACNQKDLSEIIISVTPDKLEDETYNVKFFKENPVTDESTSQPIIGIVPQTGCSQDEIFVWPWMGIIVNLPVRREYGKSVGDSGSKLKQELTMKGFNPAKVVPLWNNNGYSGTAVVVFNQNWLGFNNAMSFEKYFETGHLGKSDWRENKAHGCDIYGWVARDDDYRSGGVIGKYLRRHGDLKTISGIDAEDEQKTCKLLSNLSSEIETKRKHIEEMKCKVQKTSSSLHKVIEEREELVNDHNEEIQRMHENTQRQIRKISEEHEKKKKYFESERKKLELCGRELEIREAHTESERRRLIDDKKQNSMKNESLRLATMAQNKADEDIVKLVEAHKSDKERLRRRHFELTKQLEEKHGLELEIEQLKGSLEVMSHICLKEDSDAEHKIHMMKQKLDEKEEELEHLSDTQAALINKERKTNVELQEACKELIKNWTWTSRQAHLGLKKMGDLDIKPFKEACERIYGTEEADVKAAELCSVWDSYIRDPAWHPYKIVKTDREDKEVINDKDEKLVELKNEFGTEVYNAVATALMELNDYNPSGRYPVPELWNFDEERRASLKEGALFLLEKWKKKKGRRN